MWIFWFGGGFFGGGEFVCFWVLSDFLICFVGVFCCCFLGGFFFVILLSQTSYEEVSWYLCVYCVCIFNGILSNLCFEGPKPVIDVPKSCATCGIWNLDMCIVLEEWIFLEEVKEKELNWCSAVFFHGIAVRINRKKCLMLNPCFMSPFCEDVKNAFLVTMFLLVISSG